MPTSFITAPYNDEYELRITQCNDTAHMWCEELYENIRNDYLGYFNAHTEQPPKVRGYHIKRALGGHYHHDEYMPIENFAMFDLEELAETLDFYLGSNWHEYREVLYTLFDNYTYKGEHYDVYVSRGHSQGDYAIVVFAGKHTDEITKWIDHTLWDTPYSVYLETPDGVEYLQEYAPIDDYDPSIEDIYLALVAYFGKPENIPVNIISDIGHDVGYGSIPIEFSIAI